MHNMPQPDYPFWMRCLTCQYDLRKLSERRCPECGRAFDPNDITSYASKDHLPLGEGWRQFLLDCAIVVAAYVGVALLVVCIVVVVAIAVDGWLAFGFIRPC